MERQSPERKEEDLNRMSIEEFLKANRINPKIFTADTIQLSEKVLQGVKSIKPNVNKKHSHIQKSVMLI